MTNIPKLEQNRELHSILDLARELRLMPDYEETETDGILIIRGTGAKLLAPRFQPYVKKGVLQGNQGPDALRFVWDKANASDAPKEQLHPISKEKDDEVLALIPSRISTHEQLTKLCEALRAKIDEAYPNVLIHHRGFGKGKWLLLGKIELAVWVRGESILNRALMIYMREMLCHYQAAPGIDYGRLGYPDLPAAFAE